MKEKHSFEILLDRLTDLRDLLSQLSDEQVNMQPFSNKRSIGELTAHVIQLSGAPARMHTAILGVNRLARYGFVRREYDEAVDLSRTDPVWDLEAGKPITSKSKYRTKLLEGLEARIEKIQAKIEKQTKDNSHNHRLSWHLINHINQAFAISNALQE